TGVGDRGPGQDGEVAGSSEIHGRLRGASTGRESDDCSRGGHKCEGRRQPGESGPATRDTREDSFHHRSNHLEVVPAYGEIARAARAGRTKLVRSGIATSFYISNSVSGICCNRR